MAVDIFRPYTENEKKEFTELGAITMRDRFLEQLAKVEKTFSKIAKPFDSACAKQDFDAEVRRVTAELNGGHKNVEFKEFDLDSYGNDDRFELLSEAPVVEDKLLDGIRTPVQTGVSRRYKCKERGHGFSIFVSNDILNKNKTKTKENNEPSEEVKAKKSKKKKE